MQHKFEIESGEAEKVERNSFAFYLPVPLSSKLAERARISAAMITFNSRGRE